VEGGHVGQGAVDVDAAGVLRGAGPFPGAHDVTPDADTGRGGDGIAFRASRRLIVAAVAARHEVVVLLFGIAVNADEPLVVALVEDTAVVRRFFRGVDPGRKRIVGGGLEVQLAGGAVRNRE